MLQQNVEQMYYNLDIYLIVFRSLGESGHLSSHPANKRDITYIYICIGHPIGDPICSCRRAKPRAATLRGLRHEHVDAADTYLIQQ